MGSNPTLSAIPLFNALGSFLKRIPKRSSIRLQKSARAVLGIEEPSTRGISRYTLYECVKVEGTWRHCKAAYHDNNKINPDIVFVNLGFWTLVDGR